MLDSGNNYCDALNFTLTQMGGAVTVTATGATANNISLDFALLSPLNEQIVSTNSTNPGGKQNTFESLGAGNYVLAVCGNANSGGTVAVEISQRGF